MKFDLNCDLGEGESLARIRALMRHITSASVACGGHAGDIKSMELCVRLAKRSGVRLGAHPGVRQQDGFGRGAVTVTADALELLLLQQVGALERIARTHKVPLHHIKVHGSLYHATDADVKLGRRYLETVRRWWPQAKVYAQASGRVARLALGRGVIVWEEAFVDRGYETKTRLVLRGQPGALRTSIDDAIDRVRSIIDTNTIRTVSGDAIPIRCQTLCVHADTPHSVAIARAVKKILDRVG